MDDKENVNSTTTEKHIKLDWKYFVVYILIAVLISVLLVQCKNKRDLPKNLAVESAKSEVVNVTDRNQLEEDKDNADTRDVPGTIGESVFTLETDTSTDVSTTVTTAASSTTTPTTTKPHSSTTEPSTTKHTTTTTTKESEESNTNPTESSGDNGNDGADDTP